MKCIFAYLNKKETFIIVIIFDSFKNCKIVKSRKFFLWSIKDNYCRLKVLIFNFIFLWISKYIEWFLSWIFLTFIVGFMSVIYINARRGASRKWSTYRFIALPKWRKWWNEGDCAPFGQEGSGERDLVLKSIGDKSIGEWTGSEALLFISDIMEFANN